MSPWEIERLRRFSDSANPSLNRLKDKSNGRYNPQPNSPSPTAPPIQPPNPRGSRPSHSHQPPTQRPASTEESLAAIAAAVGLGIPTRRAQELAAQAPPNSTSASDILKFILKG